MAVIILLISLLYILINCPSHNPALLMSFGLRNRKDNNFDCIFHFVAALQNKNSLGIFNHRKCAELRAQATLNLAKNVKAFCLGWWSDSGVERVDREESEGRGRESAPWRIPSGAIVSICQRQQRAEQSKKETRKVLSRCCYPSPSTISTPDAHSMLLPANSSLATSVGLLSGKTLTVISVRKVK